MLHRTQVLTFLIRGDGYIVGEGSKEVAGGADSVANIRPHPDRVRGVDLKR